VNPTDNMTNTSFALSKMFLKNLIKDKTSYIKVFDKLIDSSSTDEKFKITHTILIYLKQLVILLKKRASS